MNSVFMIAVFSQAYMDQAEAWMNEVPWTGDKRLVGNRTWGWYASFEAANQAVVNNYTNIHESLYDWAVIEEVPEGILAFAKVRQWYHWEPTQHEGKYRPSAAPAGAARTVNFSIG